MENGLSLVADIIGIVTFLLTGLNLFILAKIRTRTFEKRYYPKKLEELKTCSGELIALCPAKASTQDQIFQKIRMIRAIVSELKKRNSIVVKIWINVFFFRLLIWPQTAKRIPKRTTTIARKLYEKISIFVYRFENRSARSRLEGAINGN